MKGMNAMTPIMMVKQAQPFCLDRNNNKIQFESVDIRATQITNNSF